MHDMLHWLSYPQHVMFKLCYKFLPGLAPDYLSRFCTLLTSVPGRPLLRSADANKLLVQRSCTTSFGPRSFGSSSLTPWNDMPAHLHTVQPGLNFKCLQTIAENCFVPDCFGVVTSRAFVTVLIW